MATTKEERIIEIVVNGQKASANIKELEGAARALSSQLRTLTPGTAEFIEKSKQLQEVRARLQGVKADITGVAQEQSLMKQGFANAFALFTGGGILAAVQKVFGFLNDSREEFLTSAKSSADLENTLKSTAHAAGLTADEIRKIGEERAKVTLFDDDETNRASALLLTFTNIKKGVFEEAMPAIQDLATKMGGDGPADMKGAAIQVGKALNDPVKGITALTRVGVSFTEQQKEQITQMVKLGDTAGAQKMILAELNKEFGGSAEAARRAGGGMATLTMRWGEMKETVGGFVSGGLDRLSHFLGVILDKSQPLVDMFTEVGEQISDFYTDIMEVVRGLGLFSSEGDAAGFIVKMLSGALTLLLIPLKLTIQVTKALVDGFVTLYNKSELVRGTISGLAAAVMSTFTTIKNAAVNILGGVGDFLQGVFTLDPAKIKAGLTKMLASAADVALAGGDRAAQAFATGYHNGKDKLIVRKSSVEAADNAKRVQDAAAQGTREAEAAMGASAKEREKARKKAEAEAKKHQAELAKARKEFHAATLKAEQEFEKLKVEAMAEGIEKTLAKLKLERNEELRGLEEKKNAVLANIAATEKGKATMLSLYRQTADMAEARYQQKVKEARAKQAEADRKEEFARLDGEEEEKIVVLDNAWLEQKIHLKKQTAEYMKAEQARAAAELNLRRKTAAAKLALLKKESKDETTEAKKLKNTILRIDGELADSQAESDKRVTEFEIAQANERKQNELDLASAKIEIGTTVLDAVMSNLDEESDAYQAFNAARKALALAEIAINLEKTLSNNAVTASTIDAGTFGIGGSVWLVVKDALAIAQAGAAAAKVAGFASGGFTGVGLGQVDATGHRVAGVVHDNEWVAPKWMLQQPKYANLIGYLEAERRGGYAQGGYTSAASLPPSAASGGSQAGDATAAAVMQLTQIMLEHNERMNKWATTLGVDYHAGNAEEAMKLRSKLKKGASLG